MIALLVTVVVLLVLIFAAVTGTLGDLFFLTGALFRGAFLLACGPPGAAPWTGCARGLSRGGRFGRRS